MSSRIKKKEEGRDNVIEKLEMVNTWHNFDLTLYYSHVTCITTSFPCKETLKKNH